MRVCSDGTSYSPPPPAPHLLHSPAAACCSWLALFALFALALPQGAGGSGIGPVGVAVVDQRRALVADKVFNAVLLLLASKAIVNQKPTPFSRSIAVQRARGRGCVALDVDHEEPSL